MFIKEKRQPKCGRFICGYNGGQNISSKKKIFNKVVDCIVARNSGWSFQGAVVDTFSDLVRRSVPLYDAGHRLICKLSVFYQRRFNLL